VLAENFDHEFLVSAVFLNSLARVT